jgi:hypothetical protein
MEGSLPFWSQLILALPFVGPRSTNDLEIAVQTMGNGTNRTVQGTSTKRDHGARLEMINMSISGRALRNNEHPSHTRTKAKGRGKAGSIR